MTQWPARKKVKAANAIKGAMNRMLRKDGTYKCTAGRVLIHTQYAPDAAGYSFLGTVPNGATVQYKADGYTETEEYRITGPWISDDVTYQPIVRGEAPTILGERFMDILDLKKKHPGKYAAKLEWTDGVPSLSVEAP